VVDDVVETPTFAGAADVPTLEVPLEPTIRPMPFTVTVEFETVVTLPEADAREKPPPPPNPPPPPLPPNPPPAALAGHGEAFPLMAIVRAAMGPAAEALVGGVPVTETHEPTATSWAVTGTVCVKAVADVHVTEVVPENRLWTFIDEPDTEVTDPDATGRPFGAVVEEPDEADEGEVVEPDVLLQAALSKPIAAANRASRRALRRAGAAPGCGYRAFMTPRFRPQEAIALVEMPGTPVLRLAGHAFDSLRIAAPRAHRTALVGQSLRTLRHGAVSSCG
jgi:hypothetical protein